MLCAVLLALVPPLACREGQVPVADHVLRRERERESEGKGEGLNIAAVTYLDLALHSDGKQDAEVDHEDRPEDRDVEDGEAGAKKGH